ncbi:MAG: SEL1-like repeat protein [Prevotella sp.]|nr:SEL1-like repeat protein [Prevotella sp.]
MDKLKEKYKGARFRNFLRSDKNCRLLASADNNDADAQFEVGEWFYGRKTGGSSEENDKEAVIWFKKAALQGHVTAQYYLALCYENGRGTPQIKDEAQKWFKKAADGGHGEAKRSYLKLKYNSDTYKYVIRNQCDLLFKADAGDRSYQYSLGEWFSIHQSLSSYRDAAFEWYTKAAENGDCWAMFKLGECYEKGLGCYSNISNAIKWYKKAANGGNETACVKLAQIYLYGKLVSKDVEEAVKWFNKAGGQISDDDLCEIGHSYYDGDEAPINKTKAFQYFKKSAEKGNITAQYHLGVCYENGTGVLQDKKKALYWYEKAAPYDIRAKKAFDRLKPPPPPPSSSCWWKLILGLGVIVFLVCIFVKSPIGPGPDDSSPKPLPPPPVEYVTMTEKIGRFDVSMSLEINSGHVSGSYRYLHKTTTDELFLSGDLDSFGNMHLIETNNEGWTTGVFSGDYAGNHYSGTFTNFRGQSMSFYLSK